MINFFRGTKTFYRPLKYHFKGYYLILYDYIFLNVTINMTNISFTVGIIYFKQISVYRKYVVKVFKDHSWIDNGHHSVSHFDVKWSLGHERIPECWRQISNGLHRKTALKNGQTTKYNSFDFGLWKRNQHQLSNCLC